jgi:hypothetical protein
VRRRERVLVFPRRQARVAAELLRLREHALEQPDHPEQRQRADGDGDRGGLGGPRGHARDTPRGSPVTANGRSFDARGRALKDPRDDKIFIERKGAKLSWRATAPSGQVGKALLREI